MPIRFQRGVDRAFSEITQRSVYEGRREPC